MARRGKGATSTNISFMFFFFVFFGFVEWFFLLGFPPPHRQGIWGARVSLRFVPARCRLVDIGKGLSDLPEGFDTARYFPIR